MELSQVNNLNMSNLNSLNSKSVKSIENVEKVSNDTSSKIEKVGTSQKLQSSFVADVSSNIDKISSLQKLKSEVNKQIEIVDKIASSTNKVLTSPKAGQVLDDIQPEIQSLMNKFNTSSKSTLTSVSNVQSSNTVEQSRTYFDGVIGAKPLSGEEIYNAVNEQKNRLEQINKVINDEIINTTSKTKELFKEERTSSQPTKFQNVDFEKESSAFTSQTLKNISGSVVDVQPNAQTEQNIKLLAS